MVVGVKDSADGVAVTAISVTGTCVAADGVGKDFVDSVETTSVLTTGTFATVGVGEKVLQDSRIPANREIRKVELTRFFTMVLL